MTNQIIVKKSRRSDNIVFLGWITDDLGFATQVVDWKKHEQGADAALEIIKTKKPKGFFNDSGNFEFHPDGLELVVE